MSSKSSAILTARAPRPPDDLTLIRLGHEDRVAEDVRHLLIDERAQDLQQRVAEATDEPFAALAQAQGDWASLVFALEHLRTSHARWSETTAALEAQRARIADLQRAIWQRHAPVITDAHAAVRQAADQAERAGARASGGRATPCWAAHTISPSSAPSLSPSAAACIAGQSHPVAPNAIGVIVPYRSQAALLRAELGRRVPALPPATIDAMRGDRDSAAASQHSPPSLVSCGPSKRTCTCVADMAKSID